IQYVGYDKQTGAIIYTYARLDAEKNQYVEVSTEALKKEIEADPTLVERVTGKSADNLEVIRVDALPSSKRGGSYMIDPKTQKLVLKPTLQLTADKTQLTGDGADNATLEIQAVDANGKPVRSLEGEVRVTTDRGKLSERGGIVKLAHGYGKLELTSVN